MYQPCYNPEDAHKKCKVKKVRMAKYPIRVSLYRRVEDRFS